MTTFAEFREEVRQRADLLSVVEQTVSIEHRGARTVKVRCPFHDDSTASLAIYPDQQRWYCYGGCREGGDVFSWIMKRDNVDFRVAVENLARAYGVGIPEWRPEPEEIKEERLKAQELLKLAADFYHECLMREPGAAAHREYLEKRGFGAAFWEQWHAGAAGKNNGLLAKLRRENANIPLAIKIGLIGEDEKDNRLYDWFRDRIVIPFIDQGRVVFMTGRAINPETQPKYLHLKNGDYARKVPYNFRGRGSDLVIVEGPFDVWAAEALADDDVSATGLMGLGYNDPALLGALKRRDRVFVALDADGTVEESIVEGAINVVGAERARLITWPGGDDAANWLHQGATAKEFAALLELSPSWAGVLVERIGAAVGDEKPKAVEKAIALAATLPPARGDTLVVQIKKAAKPDVQAVTINEMLKVARKQARSPTNGNGSGKVERTEQKAQEFYLVNGDVWRGQGEDARRVIRGGHAAYTEMVTVDDGEDSETEVTLEIRLIDRTIPVRFPADHVPDAGKVVGHIGKVVGPLLNIEPKQKEYVVSAIHAFTFLEDRTMTEVTEIARTGWIETTAGLAYVTPGGIVGNLPDGFRVALPEGLKRYAVMDGGEKSFKQGLDGLLLGFLQAFPPYITFPALAFALAPVAARWLPNQRFAMHLSGETGSLKTETAKVLMSLYGDFADSPPLASWRSTINSLEHLGFWLPDVIGLVDDYKPRIVKIWDFVELIQRYADRNDRLWLNCDAQMRRRQAMRWWLLSTGEDLPSGESSVLARMVNLRFPRRPSGSPYNADLAKAQRLAKHFPTVTARWAAWLLENQEHLGFDARITIHHQEIANHLNIEAPGVPNINRISKNLAILWGVWETFIDFILESTHPQTWSALYNTSFGKIAMPLAVIVAKQVIEEKPARVFLDALQEGLDAGRYRLLFRADATEATMGVAGWYDENGTYLLPAMFNEISKWLRESGQQIGFTKQELYRLLDEEGLIAGRGKDAATTVVLIGGTKPKRVLWLHPSAVRTPLVPHAEESDDEG